MRHAKWCGLVGIGELEWNGTGRGWNGKAGDGLGWDGNFLTVARRKFYGYEWNFLRVWFFFFK